LAVLILSEQLKFDERFVEANGIKCLKAAADLGLAVGEWLLFRVIFLNL